MKKIFTAIKSPLLNISVYRDSEFDEYVVKVRENPNATYFTDCKEDAIQTAKVMCNDGNLGIDSTPFEVTV